MITNTKVSRDYLKKDKYYSYKKYSYGMLTLSVILAVMTIVCFVYPYYNGNTKQLTAEEFQNSILTTGVVLGITVTLTILFFILTKLERNRIQNEDLEKSLHGEQKEKENIENFNPFI